MKKNLFLSAIVILLLLFAYYHEEIGNKRKELRLQVLNKIVTFDSEMVDSITLPQTKLIKTDRVWRVGELNYPANSAAIEKLLHRFQSIHKLKEIRLTEKNEKEFFIHQDHMITITSFGKKWKYRLGDVSEITGNFYFQDLSGPVKKLYLAKDVSTFEGFYRSELELYLNQYIQLKDFILGKPESYVEPRVFHLLGLKKLEKIRIDNQWNRWFEIDLMNETLTPPPRKGIKTKQLKLLTQGLLGNVKMKNLHKEGVLGEVIGTVKFYGMEKTIEAKLHESLDGQKGLYVAYSGNDWIYELDEKSKTLFFMNRQDCLDKKINYPVLLHQLKKLDFEMALGDGKYFSFHVDDIQKFEFESKSKQVTKIHVQNMNFLFNLVFGLDKFKHASEIQDVAPSGKNRMFTIQLKLLEKELQIDFYQEQIVILDLSDKYQLLYPYNFGVLGINKASDFFALK
jgi:hypothetical protein